MSDKENDANFQRIRDKSDFGSGMLNAAKKASQMEHDTFYLNQKIVEFFVIL